MVLVGPYFARALPPYDLPTLFGRNFTATALLGRLPGPQRLASFPDLPQP